jgi:hypothetical protein
MNITTQQLINPGIIEYDKKRHEKIIRFKDSVSKARFLNTEEKRHWTMLGYILNNDQLDDVQKMIINEDLRRLNTKESLEKMKPLSQSSK